MWHAAAAAEFFSIINKHLNERFHDWKDFVVCDNIKTFLMLLNNFPPHLVSSIGGFFLCSMAKQEWGWAGWRTVVKISDAELCSRSFYGAFNMWLCELSTRRNFMNLFGEQWKKFLLLLRRYCNAPKSLRIVCRCCSLAIRSKWIIH